MTAGIIGLMVITLERYFKIVHAIAHRKYYQKPEILSQLDGVGGRCAAVAGWNMSHPVPRTRHNKDRQGTMFETDLLAERSHGIGKLIWKHFVDITTFCHIATPISVQTAGLAFGGTGLCSYRVRGVLMAVVQSI